MYKLFAHGKLMLIVATDVDVANNDYMIIIYH